MLRAEERVATCPFADLCDAFDPLTTLHVSLSRNATCPFAHVCMCQRVGTRQSTGGYRSLDTGSPIRTPGLRTRANRCACTVCCKSSRTSVACVWAHIQPAHPVSESGNFCCNILYFNQRPARCVHMLAHGPVRTRKQSKLTLTFSGLCAGTKYWLDARRQALLLRAVLACMSGVSRPSRRTPSAGTSVCVVGSPDACYAKRVSPLR